MACSQQGMPAMALLDCNGVYGAPRFHMAAKKLKIRAHIGAEVSLGESVQDAPSLPLLCESQTGYQNLCRLITRTKLRVAKNKPTSAYWEELAEHKTGLICLTGGEDGPLAEALIHAGKEEARNVLSRLAGIFGRDRIFVELQRHFRREQEQVNQALIELAREQKLPLIATNGVCYATPTEREVMDALLCVKYKRQLDNAGRLLERNAERYLRRPEEMARIFADLQEAIANTSELSSRLDFTLEKLGYQFPRYPVPEGETMASFLHHRAMEGARERYRPLDERVRRQMERELALIEKLDLAGYFLIVWDLVRFCRENGILVQGRGSAANSAVCYALGITAVDPIKMELLFERFLSEERGEWPDIDLDLPSDTQRERVIQYVYKRYGEAGAAMTANVVTYRGRMAAREMGKVCGFDPENIDRLSKVVGSWEWKDPQDTLDKQFTQAGFDLRNERIARYLDLCLRVRDLPRHLSQHSGGMVICQGQLDSVVPLEPATMPGRVVVQWDKDDCADLGIVKVDLLGLGMMAVLEDCIQLIRRHHQEEISLAHLPQNDEAPDVYDAIRNADTVGMFQVESRAQMASLPRNDPKKFYDLVVQVALIRPGPIVGQMTNPYLERRQGRQAVTYPHPALEPVLERTLGVPLFQEQLLRMAMICANFSGGEAEELRRALGSKRSEQRMREVESKLRAGMEKNGITGTPQDEIVKFITSFALYGFPESHSASFALLAYASAYLKVRYLAAFTAALLNNQPMGFYHPSTLIKDAQRHGLRVKPVDVTCSEWPCSLEPLPTADSSSPRQFGMTDKEFALRLGLRYVRGLRQATAQALVEERKRGAFRSISDLAARVPQLNKSDFAMLAKIGALNHVGEMETFAQKSLTSSLHRRDALWQSQKAAQRPGPLLREIPEADAASPLAPMNSEERLLADYHGTGMTVGPHPMFYRREELRRRRILSAAELRQIRDGRPVRAAGLVITRQRPGTAKGLIFLSLEDETGIANVIIQPELYAQDPLMVIHEKFVLVEGRVQNRDQVVHVQAERLMPLRDELKTQSLEPLGVVVEFG